ncbi:hypothetical protein BJ085DRAFT_9721, partial [Dimargaris cristalligena]
KRHICNICKSSFLKPSMLDTHMRSHTGDRPYPCGYYELSFKVHHVLNRHM